jgi:hypothetical protein
MRIFFSRHGVAMTSIVAALFAVAVVVSLSGRIEKLESEIKSLRSDLENPRARPALTFDAEAHLRQ